jgi:N utilization substance protein A
MNPDDLLRMVDAIHREKNIPKETVFESVEASMVSALRKHFADESELVVQIDRRTGRCSAWRNGQLIEQDQFDDLVGRIGAQTAKQVMIQRIREAERDSLFDEYTAERGQLVTGVVQRCEGGTATVSLNNTEAILPRSEQIPGESHHANERVRATICDVRKAGSRVKIILSRTRPELVQRLFEQEIPEIGDGVIEIHQVAREPGYRSKVAVSTSDPRVDPVGACVGVRGNRIKNIVDELAGERIDIVRWSDDAQELIAHALQPATVDEVILCSMLGKAIVLVQEDQLSLAIGKRGQNVRLASKLCGWDIEIMTREELDESIERAVAGFSMLEGVTHELAEQLVGEGFLTYDELSVIEPDDLAEMGGLTPEQVEHIIAQAERKAEEAEAAAAEERRRQKERERQQREAAAEAPADAAPAEAAAVDPRTTAANGQVPQADELLGQAADQGAAGSESVESSAATSRGSDPDTP